MLNQGLIEEGNQGILSSSHLGFCLNPISNLTSSFLDPFVSNQQSIDDKPFMSSMPCSFAMDHATCALTQALLSSTTSSYMPQLVSPQRSTSNLWASGEGKECLGVGKRTSCEDSLGLSPVKMKKIKGRRKVREPRFCFKTMSDVDVLDDGYKWRKYGQKVVKNTLHPRSYYRCTQDNCRVKKRVERMAEDPRMVITTYEGRHAHSPSHELDENSQQGQPHLNNFFW